MPRPSPFPRPRRPRPARALLPTSLTTLAVPALLLAAACGPGETVDGSSGDAAAERPAANPGSAPDAPVLDTVDALLAEAPPPRPTLLGDPVRPPDLPPEIRARLEKDLEIARAVLAVAPERQDSWIWLGRRLGYLARNPEAVAVFTEGLERFPESYELHRFRGRHRARNRDFEGALADYRRGLELMEGVPDSFEPDGIINAQHRYLGTYRSNLHYYLAQTSWATGDWETLVEGMERAAAEPLNASVEYTIPNAYWRYMGLRKLGRDAEARAVVDSIPPGLDLIENDTYYRGVQHLQGRLTREEALEGADAVVRFAVAMKDRLEGREERAEALLREIVTESPGGFWPAEAELVRIGGGDAP